MLVKGFLSKLSSSGFLEKPLVKVLTDLYVTSYLNKYSMSNTKTW